MPKLMDANVWAREVWTRATQNWEERSQDHNYRDLVARPGILAGLKKLLQNSPVLKNKNFLDIGCAEGTETLYMRDLLIRMYHTGIMYGYDPQGKFVDSANTKSKPNPIIPTIFENNSLEETLRKHNLFGKIDLVTSIFVLQDLPNIKDYLSKVDKALKDDGKGMFLLVHPNFAEEMLKKGALKKEEQLIPNDEWRFAGEYPIVEERGRTFFVPYFHRTIEDYKKYFSEHFSKFKFIGLKPSEKNLEIAKINHLSPFYQHEGNVYYPEIIQTESSVIILAER